MSFVFVFFYFAYEICHHLRSIKTLSKSVGALCSVSGRAHRSPTDGFLLLQHFNYFMLSSPHRCFISEFV